MTEGRTLYDAARLAMGVEIDRYLRLSAVSDSFTKAFAESSIHAAEDLRLLAAGLGLPPTGDLALINRELARKRAISFDVEAAVTRGVYAEARPFATELFERASALTKGWSEFSAASLNMHPEILPVLQHVGGVFSKAALKKEVGSVSDRAVSRPAAERLSRLLLQRVRASEIDRVQVLARLESTLEGIVRDLVGRMLLEDVVAHALTKEGVPFMREDEYPTLGGVVYDFRADFVIPDPAAPLAFIEVRKSSSRHASLYAKDKMFSAINWKGRHRKLIGVMIVEGDWTQATLRVMAAVFDYVIPLARSLELAKTLRRAWDGDETVLKWLVDFHIEESPHFKTFPGQHPPGDE